MIQIQIQDSDYRFELEFEIEYGGQIPIRNRVGDATYGDENSRMGQSQNPQLEFVVGIENRNSE